ncbi:hypothetical protein MTR67_051111 [Solanum verrucosum]|uniref:Uncharacterized protein n=1 Tax=Solanum verrucosum TaxID=315347 RepID=A0AAF0V6L6_SOLVR|nr:hypothetical protein MTR67_051111 [Solanum verrucosum]
MDCRNLFALKLKSFPQALHREGLFCNQESCPGPPKENEKGICFTCSLKTWKHRASIQCG